MSECQQHQHIEDTLGRLVKNTDQIIDGLFGALDRPGEGFIAKTDKEIAKTNHDIQDLQKSMSMISRVFWMVSGAAIVALVNSIWKVI